MSEKPFQAGTMDFIEDAVESLMASGDRQIDEIKLAPTANPRIIPA